MEDKKIRITVIIPAYDAESTIMKTLSFLHRQDYEEEVQIIVVNSSQDQTEQAVRRRFPDVEVIQLEKRAYTGEAKNIGLKKAQGEVIAFIDSDCVPEKNWLSTVRQLYLKGHPIVGGAIGNLNPENKISRAEYLLESVQLSPGSRARSVSLISTANCFIGKEIFEKHGLFPTIRKGVDMLFSYHLTKKGEKILFSPEMRIDHACSTDFLRFIRKQVYHGEYSILARKEAGMPGSFLSRHVFLIPLLPLVRSFFILKHILTLDRRLARDLIQSFPIFMAGVLAWSLGCARSIIRSD